MGNLDYMETPLILLTNFRINLLIEYPSENQTVDWLAVCDSIFKPHFTLLNEPFCFILWSNYKRFRIYSNCLTVICEQTTKHFRYKTYEIHYIYDKKKEREKLNRGKKHHRHWGSSTALSADHQFFFLNIRA